MLMRKALSLALGLGVTESYTAGRSSVRLVGIVVQKGIF